MRLVVLRRIFAACIFLWIAYAVITWFFFKNISPSTWVTGAAAILIVSVDRFFDFLEARRNRT